MNARPTLAFAHANGFPGGSYRCFLSRLEARYEPHAVPLLGHDPRYPVDAHWQSLSRELEAWLEGLPRPLVGVGHSMGGVLMFMVASRRPEWFEALVMLDPPLINGLPGVAFNVLRHLGMGDRITPAGKSLGRRAHWPGRDSVDSYFRSRTLFRRFDPRCLNDYLEAGLEADDSGFHLRFDPAVEVAIFRTTPGNTGRHAPLAVPGAVISGAQSDRRFHDAAARHARRQKMLHRFAPGGHLFPLEQPERAADAVLAVLDALAEEQRDAG